jgi:hypothetical protein
MGGHGGSAYRLGGDEFCIRPGRPRSRRRHHGRACQAVTAHGGGFHITASYGTVLLPEESQDVTEAMQLVDQRIYAQKTSGRRSPDRQSRDVLLRALQERTPELAGPHAATAKLVRSTHERLDGGGYPDGLAGEQIPVGARIIAVYDAFTAMTSPAPRPAAGRPRGRGRAAPRFRQPVRPGGGGRLLRAGGGARLAIRAGAGAGQRRRRSLSTSSVPPSRPTFLKKWMRCWRRMAGSSTFQ